MPTNEIRDLVCACGCVGWDHDIAGECGGCEKCSSFRPLRPDPPPAPPRVAAPISDVRSVSCVFCGHAASEHLAHARQCLECDCAIFRPPIPIPSAWRPDNLARGSRCPNCDSRIDFTPEALMYSAIGFAAGTILMFVLAGIAKGHL